MPATLINLTVRSKNSATYTTATTQDFVVDRMGEIVANKNAATTASVTEAGDTANQLSSWSLTGTGNILYWKLSNSGSDRTVTLYRGQNGALPVATGTVNGDGIIYGQPLNQSGIYFTVTVAYSADDADNGNTVQLTTFEASYDIELPGNSQFSYEEADGHISKYTVDETLTQIATEINNDTDYKEATLELTTAQITILNGTPVAIIATPGAGKMIEILSAVAIYYYGVAQYTTRTDFDLVSGTTGTQLWTAASAVAGSSNKITRFIAVAGVMQANQAIKVKMNTGNPTVGAGCTGTAKVIVTYRISDV